MGAAQAGAGGRSAIRPRDQRAVPPRDPIAALQAGQAAAAMPDRPDHCAAAGRPRISVAAVRPSRRLSAKGRSSAVCYNPGESSLQGNARKSKQKSFVSFYFLLRIWTYQWVTAEKIKKSSRPSARVLGCGRTARKLAFWTPNRRRSWFLIAEKHSKDLCFAQGKNASVSVADDMSGLGSARSVR